jgi:hypothetical protein
VSPYFERLSLVAYVIAGGVRLFAALAGVVQGCDPEILVGGGDACDLNYKMAVTATLCFRSPPLRCSQSP